MSAADVAARRGTVIRQGDEYRGPCPLCGGKMTMKDGDRQLLVTCYGTGCDRRKIIAELHRLGELDDSDASPDRPERTPEQKAEEIAERTKLAKSLWRGSVRVLGTKGERYLESRGIVGAGTNPSLRFVPDFKVTRGVIVPALIAAAASPARVITAAQLTFLSHDGDRKADIAGGSRRTFGCLGVGAVRLAPPDTMLGIAEGVETALSAMQLFNMPVWACLGAARMHQVEIPEGVRELYIFADNDEPGRVAAERTIGAHPNLEVDVIAAPAGSKDWNDTLRSRGAGND